LQCAWLTWSQGIDVVYSAGMFTSIGVVTVEVWAFWRFRHSLDNNAEKSGRGLPLPFVEFFIDARFNPARRHNRPNLVEHIMEFRKHLSDERAKQAVMLSEPT
jgi:hypothetical protein